MLNLEPDLTTAEEIGARVRATRKHYRITQVQLAELSGLSDKTVRDIEHGTGTASLAAVIAVLNVVGLRLEVC
ncbi:predicted transcriptional regulator [Corynebacterium renale]|uniref:Y4mF family transcriptional regulator n=1 Tax=Corynebacterium renale TaxID=1724 RepID=A0A2A9DRQ1_9CORY|nr:helix-turn-helix domain-containing protein [Corynebacterium renale]PFG28835.1 y4mF family transcriptional regulator [Corynebacterium renale]SQG64573.1 predicted transcriptional regulator [Corynebacterium renale]SQI25675.1 predicted transcriptional regulator [Corynebacterium renale]STC95611.1 predicted transcriptional regulator [Corynebacterium renale]